MPNNYYTRVYNAQPETLARSADVRGEFDGIVSAFDRLPDPHPTLEGFNIPIVVGTPTDLLYATNKQYVDSFVSLGLLGASSLSSVTFGTGSKNFTVVEAAARAFVVGTELKVVSSAIPSKYMLGVVAAYAHPSVTINVTYSTDISGSASAWVMGPTSITPFARWPAGTTANPGLATDSDPTNGFWAALNQHGGSIGGTSRWNATASAFTFSVAPTWASDPSAADQLSRKSYTDAQAAAAQTAANSYSDTRLTTGVATMTNKTVTNPAHTTQALTDGATINWDLNAGHIATVTLGAAGRTMANPSNLKAGSAMLTVRQDATGSRTITSWGSTYRWPGGTPPALSTAPNAVDIITFVSDGTNLFGNILRGFA